MSEIPVAAENDSGNLDEFVKDLVKFDPGGSSLKPSPSLVDVLVYRIRSSNTEKEGRETIQTNLSFASGGGGSRVSTRMITSFLENRSFTFREYMLLIIEMFISFAWFTIYNRRLKPVDLLEMQLTVRMELMDLYLVRGLSGFGAVFAGYVADTYVGIYPVAVLNIVLHFLVVAILLMEEVIKYEDFDFYHTIVWKTVGWSFIPLKATDFARMVFGLENIRKKNMKAVILYVFLSVWLSERSCGGILVLVISVFHFSEMASIRISFIITGIASGLYLFFFRPDPSRTNFVSGLGKKIIECIIAVLWTKWKLRGVVKYKAPAKYEGVYLNKSKQLLRIYVMMIPTVGLLFFVASRSDFYTPVWHKMKPYSMFKVTGIINGARIITITTMALLSLVILPVLQGLGYKRNFLCQFVIGYLSALMCFYTTSSLMWALESTMPPFGLGLIRLLNAGNVPLHVISRDPRMIYRDTIQPESGIMVAISLHDATMYKIMFRFENGINFTSRISVAPNEPSAYVIVDPPEVMRVEGLLPLWESPPGYNAPYQARLFLSNLIRHTNCTLNFLGLNKGKTGRYNEYSGIAYQIKVDEGKSGNLVLPAGVYFIKADETILKGNRRIFLGQGGVYIIVLFSTPTSHRLHQDIMVDENEMSASYTFFISIPYAVALVFSYVSVQAFLYVNTPDGLEGLSFGFYESLENNSCWVIWMGYHTWHPYITSSSLIIYSVILTLLFFFCLYLLLKNESHYRW